MAEAPLEGGAAEGGSNAWFEGAVAGACVGAMLGASEAAWLAVRANGLRELELVVWTPIAMALAAALLGACVGALAGRAGRAPAASAMAILLLAAGPFWFRYRVLIDAKDWIERDGISFSDVFAASVLLGCVLAALGWGFATRLRLPALVAASAILSALALGFGLAAHGAKPPRDFSGVRTVETANLSKRNARAATLRPDAFFIVVDSLRADHLSSHDPDSPASTPTIDAFARDAVRFANFCAQSSWTKPTFASLITGLHPRTHTAARRESQLPRDVTTLAEAFRDAGYYTVGSSNANPNNSAWANFDQGFTEWYEFAPSKAWWGAPWSATHTILYQRGIDALQRATVGYRVHHFYLPAEDLSRWAQDWLEGWRRPKNVPLFLSLHYMDPHQPHFGGREQGPMMNRGWLKEGVEHPSLETMREGYAGDVEALDAGLAILFDGLRERGLYDDALIVLTSDHGQEFLEHGSWAHGETLYIEQLAVPLIVKLPGNRGAGRVVEGVASQLDVPPTVLSLLEIEVPDAMQGRVLVESSGEVRESPSGGCFASLERGDGRHLEAVQREDATWIEVQAPGESGGTQPELYDRVADPAQQRNLAGRGDERERELSRALRAKLERFEGDRIDASQREIDADLEAQLRALGYLE